MPSATLIASPSFIKQMERVCVQTHSGYLFFLHHSNTTVLTLTLLHKTVLTSICRFSTFKTPPSLTPVVWTSSVQGERVPCSTTSRLYSFISYLFISLLISHLHHQSFLAFKFFKDPFILSPTHLFFTNSSCIFSVFTADSTLFHVTIQLRTEHRRIREVLRFLRTLHWSSGLKYANKQTGKRTTRQLKDNCPDHVFHSFYKEVEKISTTQPLLPSSSTMSPMKSF